jgi:uncharacterized protein YjiS (DUF1127 family)
MRVTHGSFEQYTTAQIEVAYLDTGHQIEGDQKMNIRQKLAQFVAYQRTVRELDALDNRQLNDLGIQRADIKRLARATAL